MKRWPLVPVLAMVALLPAGHLHADETVWTEGDILGQRLVMDIPQGAVIETDERLSGTADSIQQQDARIVHESGDHRLTVSVSEMFVFAGEDFSSAMSELLSGWAQSEGSSMQFIPLAGHEHLVMGLIESPNTEDDQILVAAAFLRHFDNTVLRLSVDINRVMYADLEMAREMSHRMLYSARPARQGLPLLAGERFISLPGEQMQLVMDLPDNHVITAQQGPDFSVYRVVRVTGINEPSPSLGIYVGGHPALHHKSVPEPALTLGTVDARLFERKQVWYRYQVTQQAGVQIETVAGIPGLDDYWRIHLFGSALTESGVFDLLDMLKTARIRPTEGGEAGIRGKSRRLH